MSEKGAEMKEILYNKSKAVAALNSVEGFYPMDLARKLVKEGQEDQLYLDVKYRKLWSVSYTHLTLPTILLV